MGSQFALHDFKGQITQIKQAEVFWVGTDPEGRKRGWPFIEDYDDGLQNWTRNDLHMNKTESLLTKTLDRI